MIASNCVISMRPTLMLKRLERTYEVVKGWARWAASCWQAADSSRGTCAGVAHVPGQWNAASHRCSLKNHFLSYGGLDVINTSMQNSQINEVSSRSKLVIGLLSHPHIAILKRFLFPDSWMLLFLVHLKTFFNN